MMKHLTIVVGVIALLALFAVQASAKEITVRGRLGRTVEAGGWLILVKPNGTATTKYLLLNPQRFQKESWFRAGTEVEATGEIQADAITIYQEGTPFHARLMQPVGGQGGAPATGNRQPCGLSRTIRRARTRLSAFSRWVVVGRWADSAQLVPPAS
jgi:hypothetical protein